jgi:hypothetical protein
MPCRSILAAALAACTIVPVLAEDSATFVLTNGQRHNGMLVYGRGDNNIVDGNFHLLTSGGEQVFPMGAVAVIDFAGGTPPTAEVRALQDDSQMMVMRNGQVIRGNLHNIIRGDLVQWVPEGGSRQNISTSAVRRLYLNTGNARSTYLRNVPSNTVGAGGNVSAVTIRVDANQQWTDTGMDVRSGDRIQFNGSGQVSYAPGPPAVGPSGARAGRNDLYPVPNMGPGGLIAKVGDSAPFPVGAGARQLTMSSSGRLYLGVNDDMHADNTGAFQVAVRRR